MGLQKDKQRYEREMAHYVPQDGFQKGKRQKRKKDPNAPKRPQTAFFVYSAKFRAEVKSELGEGSRVGDVAKELGKRWKQMTDADKKEYSDEAARQKADYEVAMEEYRANDAKRAKHESEESLEENDY